jgi:DNA-binding response OmpR family regulator
MTEAVLHEPAQQGRLLIADDDEPSRRLLRDLFRKQGYTVTEARNGEEALRLARATLPDVILLDVMMPKLDGWGTLRRIREDSNVRPVPVLLVTALHERADRLKGMACGANDFISKPFDTEEIQLRVRNALRLKRLHDEVSILLSKRETLSDMIVHDIRNPLLAIRLTAMQIAGAPNPASAQSLAT